MINFVGINPIKALVFTAVFNGVAAVPLIFIIARMAASKKIMGEYKSGWLSNLVVWATFVLMGAPRSPCSRRCELNPWGAFDEWKLRGYIYPLYQPALYQENSDVER